MTFFQNTSIRRKQMLIIMATSSVVLFLACVAFTIYEVIAFRETMKQNVTTVADMVVHNTTAALDFNDAKSAEETLSALQADSGIIGAWLYDKNGQFFAKYDRPNDDIVFAPPAVLPSGIIFQRHRLIFCRPVVFKGESIGTLYLESDMHALYSRLAGYAWIVALVFLISWLIAFVLSSKLQRLVSDPILRLAQTARSVALEKNYSARATKQSGDELGQLVDGFNEMLVQIQARDTALQTARDNLEKRVEERTRELENIHKELIVASRRGGMAEIATNVLHNVGNVLNSVNISTSLILEKTKKSRVSGVGRVVNLLEQHTHDLGEFITLDSRGKHLPAHLADLAKCLTSDQEAVVTELDSLRRNVEHIKEIVAMQQNYARVGGVKDTINVLGLVEDAIALNERGFRRHGVEVVREFEPVPPMTVEKHKVLQILVNLLANAKHACEESERADKRLTVRVAHGAGRLTITVADNGVGIPAENSARIFNHGFTTRKDGHGFGLHSGALAAREMGGSLTAHSDGPAKGATFILELPCQSRENSNE